MEASARCTNGVSDSHLNLDKQKALPSPAKGIAVLRDNHR